MAEVKEIGEHSPDQYFQNWTARNLPSCKNYWISDVDAILRDRRGNIAIVEIKRYQSSITTSQSITYQILDYALKSINKTLVPVSIHGGAMQIPVKYKGFYLVQFEKTSFEDGKVFLNYRESSEKEIIELFSFLT